MKEISATPWRYDGHGINDASGNRLATMGQEAYGHFDSKDPTRWCRNPTRDKDAELMAAAPAMHKALSELVGFSFSGVYEDRGHDAALAALIEIKRKTRAILAQLDGAP